MVVEKPRLRDAECDRVEFIDVTTDEISATLALMRAKYRNFQSHWLSGLCSTGDHRWRVNRSEIVLPHTAYAQELWGELVRCADPSAKMADEVTKDNAKALLSARTGLFDSFSEAPVRRVVSDSSDEVYPSPYLERGWLQRHPSIEALELSDLPYVLFENKRFLPSISGVYLVVDKLGKVGYVGESENLNSRWKNHDRSSWFGWFDGVRIYYLGCDREVKVGIEAALVLKFDPCYNRTPLINRACKFKAKCKPLSPEESVCTHVFFRWALTEAVESKGSSIEALSKSLCCDPERLFDRYIKPNAIRAVCATLGCKGGDVVVYRSRSHSTETSPPIPSRTPSFPLPEFPSEPTYPAIKFTKRSRPHPFEFRKVRRT